VVATLGRKAQEPGVAAFAARHGLPIRGFPASVLAAVPVPTPSTQVAAHVGTPSVCEAAALLAAGGPLVVPKRKGARATVAIARRTYPADEA
jgi:cobalamin biosynthesis protein CbiG